MEHPLWAILRRLLLASALLVFIVACVWLDRNGYRDSADSSVDLLDATYYATVSLSTTGYGDITPVSDRARLLNVLLVTPARVAFLIILVGTTLAVLTERSREAFRVRRWRSTVHEHIVVCGYGTKGRSAVRALIDKGHPASRVVVIDPDRTSIEEANAAGLAGVVGSATRTEILRQADIADARAIIVAPKTDEAAVLITLTARQLNSNATIIAAVREAENASLLRQSGADSVITTSEAAGRLLGLSTDSPRLASVVEDLLSYGSGLDIVERAVTPDEVGTQARAGVAPVLAVVRAGALHHYDSPAARRLEAGDRLVIVCKD